MRRYLISSSLLSAGLIALIILLNWDRINLISGAIIVVAVLIVVFLGRAMADMYTRDFDNE